ncbi:hypothetical protein EVAR_37162_1 [Eumeta japonica]|uniref:Uncharacterized protein n=1 Tax=Eumeta variegata TaxID=151549 RepID=A0A4C1WLK9_EUMVA|nr:hypothetical protein EVAR_37162_1 [Eumeta japonica]
MKNIGMPPGSDFYASETVEKECQADSFKRLRIMMVVTQLFLEVIGEAVGASLMQSDKEIKKYQKPFFARTSPPSRGRAGRLGGRRGGPRRRRACQVSIRLARIIPKGKLKSKRDAPRSGSFCYLRRDRSPRAEYPNRRSRLTPERPLLSLWSVRFLRICNDTFEGLFDSLQVHPMKSLFRDLERILLK